VTSDALFVIQPALHRTHGEAEVPLRVRGALETQRAESGRKRKVDQGQHGPYNRWYQHVDKAVRPVSLRPNRLQPLGCPFSEPDARGVLQVEVATPDMGAR
jgi:hypothetical protein